MKQPIGPEHLSLLKFDRVWVREACFVDLPDQHVAPPKEQIANLQVTIEVKVSVSGDRASVVVRAAMLPPPRELLFATLSAAVEGLFSLDSKGDRALLEGFAKVQAPVLLLPYLRQVVTTLTAQSRLGGVILPPLNMTGIIDQMRVEAVAPSLTEGGR